MIEIQDTLVSEEIFEKEFVCNLHKCKGACCVAGDSGAPLIKSELEQIKNSFDAIKKYLLPDSLQTIEEKGFYEIDKEGEIVTPLVRENERCVYIFFDEEKTAKCAFEHAYKNKEIDFIKPISCHLYPIRVKEYATFKAVNYDKWEICNDACVLGKELKVLVFSFLKTPLIRAFGTEWYEELLLIEKHWNK